MSAGVKELTDALYEWRSDATKFVRDMFGVRASAQQEELLRAASAPGSHVAVKSGHGTGKSTVLSWLILWGLVCFGDECKIPCTAPTAHQLEDVLWAEVRKWRGKMLEPWKSALRVTSDEVKIDTLPGFAVARTGRKENPEALQGFHSDNLIFVIDEASGIDDTVFEVARGALSTPDARVIMTSNPTRTSGFFYKAFHANRERWVCLTFNGEDSPLVSKEYALEMSGEYGRESDIYRVRVLGEFPSGGDLQFIKATDAEECLARFYAPETYKAAPVALGVDVAAFGGDRTVIVKRQGLHAHVLWSVQGCDTTTCSGKVMELSKSHAAQAIFVDATGVGFGVLSELQSLGFRPHGVQFGGAAVDAKQFKNKRAECWSRLRDWITTGGGWIEGGQYADRIRDDLTGPDYFFDMTGHLQLERKEDMKKRGVASPDYADAFALTFAAPINVTARKFNNPRAGSM